MIIKVISGGQTGADQGGLFAAKKLGIPTGGYIPKGFRTEKGSEPWIGEEFRLVESWSKEFHIRTYQNAWASDGSIRFARDFSTRGEICTLKAIKNHKKPYIDVDFCDCSNETIQRVVDWIKSNNIKVLNVAGNRESSCPGLQAFVEKFITEVVERLKNED